MGARENYRNRNHCLKEGKQTKNVLASIFKQGILHFGQQLDKMSQPT